MDDQIGARIRGLRGVKNQRSFSEELGVSLRAYKYYEMGERVPPGPVLARLAELCEVSVDWILTGQEAGADRVEEEGPRYSLRADPVLEQIRVLLGLMDDEERKKVLEYAEFISKRKKGGL